MRIFRTSNIAAAALLLFPWFAGCASVGQVAESYNHTGVYSYRHHVDRFSGVTSDEVRGAFDVVVPSVVPFMSALRAEPFTVRRWVGPDSDAPSYSVVVYYSGDDQDKLGQVSAGQTLTLVLDGAERIPLDGAGAVAGRGAYSSDLYAVATYAITRRQLEHVATAKKVEVRLDGDRGSETGLMRASLRKSVAGLLALFGR